MEINLMILDSFITAPNSRDRLSITTEMAQKVFSYLQVMPEFLDCLLPFGLRERSLDCYSTSFQACDRDEQTPCGLRINALGRSGRQMEHCYGLRSVERSPSQTDWPWSIRPCSVYHSLDLESGSSSWVIVKANRLIQTLVRDAYVSQSRRTPPSDYPPARSVAEAMETHRLIATWCTSTWSQYIGFLESSLQELTRPTLSATFERKEVPLANGQVLNEMSMYIPTVHERDQEYEEKPTAPKRITSSLRSLSQRVSTFRGMRSKSDAPVMETTPVTQHAFTFKDIPRVHFIEEKANEATNIMANNEDVLEDLKLDYEEVIANTADLQDRRDCKAALAKLVKHIERAQNNLRRQRGRIEQLLKLLEGRKALVCIHKI